MGLLNWFGVELAEQEATPVTPSTAFTLVTVDEPLCCLRIRGHTTLHWTSHGILAALSDREYTYLPYDTSILTDPLVTKALFDAKAWYHRYPDMQGVTFDIMLAHYLLYPNKPHDLHTVLRRPGLDVDEDAVEICHRLQRCTGEQQSQLSEQGLTSVFFDMEVPLTKVLQEMEANGVRIDAPRLSAFTEGLVTRAKVLEDEIYAHAGGRFKLRSTVKELPDVLYTKLALPKGPRTKRGYSTESKHLRKLKDTHPIVPALLAWRKLDKLLNTYTEKLPALVADDGLLHCQFNQNVCVTGRLSSSKPNLQNIPVRTEDGREVRRGFLPRQDGWVIFAADYSQIELRVLAHYSQDETLVRCYTPGTEEDLHTGTARTLFQCECPTSDQRRLAKIVNFALPYGTSAYGLAEQLETTEDFAQWLHDSYFERFPGVTRYMLDMEEFARKHGFVTTLTGRRRPTPNINTPNMRIQAAATREAVNMPIQGTAADIMKLALLRVHRALQPFQGDARLLMQVHDEVVLDCREEVVYDVAWAVKLAMERAYTLRVPLVAEVKWGPNWGDTKEVTL